MKSGGGTEKESYKQKKKKKNLKTRRIRREEKRHLATFGRERFDNLSENWHQKKIQNPYGLKENAS